MLTYQFWREVMCVHYITQTHMCNIIHILTYNKQVSLDLDEACNLLNCLISSNIPIIDWFWFWDHPHWLSSGNWQQVSTEFFHNCRQSSSSSHCGSVADEPDTRSSPSAGARFEENNPDCTSTLGNPIKNNGYDRNPSSANDEMMERLSNDQGAEGT